MFESNSKLYIRLATAISDNCSIKRGSIDVTIVAYVVFRRCRPDAF